MPRPKRIVKYGRGPDTYADALDRHRFEHWLVNNQTYLITARCRDRYHAFRSDQAKAIFFERFEFYTQQAGFEPWITTLVENHYHTVGYIQLAVNLKVMIQRIHGSVAKLVNDVLESQGLQRRTDFWRDRKGQEWFDGCLRDENQLRRSFEYVRTQSERHGICANWRDYPWTRITLELDDALDRARRLDAYLPDVPYKRYDNQRK